MAARGAVVARRLVSAPASSSGAAAGRGRYWVEQSVAADAHGEVVPGTWCEVPADGPDSEHDAPLVAAAGAAGRCKLSSVLMSQNAVWWWTQGRACFYVLALCGMLFRDTIWWLILNVY